MGKKPAERYADCKELAEDLRRWLADEPITARRIGLPERFVRWCRRNPAVAGLSGAAIVLLCLAALASSVGYLSTSRALTKANDERQRARGRAATGGNGDHWRIGGAFARRSNIGNKPNWQQIGPSPTNTLQTSHRRT